jgi:hypothetical protein
MKSDNCILQVPISKKLLNEAKVEIKKIGFNSIQSYTRFLFAQIASGDFKIESRLVKTNNQK